MGIIQKQGISNSILILIGAMIGALNVLVLYPLILPEEYFGLTSVLVQVSFIASQFGLLGTNIAIVKYWNTLKNNFILFRFLFTKTVLFSFVVLFILFFWKSSIIEEYQDSASLFTENYDYIYLMFLFGIVVNFFASVSQANLKTSFPIFLKQIGLRIYQTIILIAFYYEAINLNSFLLLYVLGYGFEAIVVLYYVILQKTIKKPKENSIIEKSEKKRLFKYSIVNFLTGFSGSIVTRLDVLMVGALMINPLIENYGLKAAAVYTVAVYVTNILEMPSRGIFSISTPIISRLWNENNLKEIGVIYKKVSINLTIVTTLMFALLWVNIDDLLFFMPKYQDAKWIILILGLSKIINMSLGVNNIIVVGSKYYRVGTYTMLMLIFIAFGFNYMFIPKYGLEGAALGSLLSIVIFNLVTFLFLYTKFKLQPFTWNTLKTFVLGGVIFYAFTFVNIEIKLLSIVVKSVAMGLIYLVLIYKLKLSLDINNLLDKIVLNRLRK